MSCCHEEYVPKNEDGTVRRGKIYDAKILWRLLTPAADVSPQNNLKSLVAGKNHQRNNMGLFLQKNPNVDFGFFETWAPKP